MVVAAKNLSKFRQCEGGFLFLYVGFIFIFLFRFTFYLSIQRYWNRSLLFAMCNFILYIWRWFFIRYHVFILGIYEPQCVHVPWRKIAPCRRRRRRHRRHRHLNWKYSVDKFEKIVAYAKMESSSFLSKPFSILFSISISHTLLLCKLNLNNQIRQ